MIQAGVFWTFVIFPPETSGQNERKLYVRTGRAFRFFTSPPWSAPGVPKIYIRGDWHSRKWNHNLAQPVLFQWVMLWWKPYYQCLINMIIQSCASCPQVCPLSGEMSDAHLIPDGGSDVMRNWKEVHWRWEVI